MRIRTAISRVTQDGETVRGHDLLRLISERPFVEVVFLLLLGREPEERETAMLNAALVAAIDHGAAPGSSIAARVVSSGGNEPHVALAAGLLAQGTLHGGAIEGAARLFLESAASGEAAEALVARFREAKRRLPGYGHKYLSRDRRSAALLERARALGCFGSHCRVAEAIEAALNAGSSKSVPLNIDGAMAAVFLELGFSPAHLRGLFALSRLPGLLAQIVEEQQTGEHPRRLGDDEIDYLGP